MIIYDKAWEYRQKVLKAVGTVYTVSLCYLLVVSLMGVTLLRQVQSPENRKAQAATCSLPATITSTLEITPSSADNIIDCSGQSITIASGGKLVVKSYKVANSSYTDDGGAILKVDNLTIETGGELSVTGQGYVAGDLDGSVSGSASGVASTGVAGGSGGANGGSGGIGNSSGGSNQVGIAGFVIGAIDTPQTLGGAGGNAGGGGTGGTGGGAIHVVATGTILVDGNVTANGLDGVKSADNQSSGGGGAGGSVWLEGNVINGTGKVSAKGGTTDRTAGYIGGGGGGGRIAIVCTTSTNLTTANVDYSFGTGSQDGQPGTIIGPGCKPAAPTVLKFFEKSSTAGNVDRELFSGDFTTHTALTFASDLNGQDLYLEVEVVQKDQPFTNIKTKGQITAMSNKTCTGLPTGNGVTISSYCGFVEITSGLIASKEYKWQARIASSAGLASNWVQFGGSDNNVTDFTISGAPASMIIVEGNNLSTTVTQQTSPNPKVRVLDASGFRVPFSSVYTWAVQSGGGSVANGQTVTDKWGEMTAEWTIGQTAGVNNNTLRVSGNSLAQTFTVSAIPGAIASYVVTAGTTLSMVNASFPLTVVAKDAYGNIVPFANSLLVSAVNANDVNTPGLGTFNPDSVLFNGTATFPNGWSARRKVTFNNTQANLSVAAQLLTDYPVAIHLTASNFDFSQTKANGADVRVTDSNGNLLPYEIEKWDASAQDALIWTKVPAIQAESNTDFVYVYYGNPGVSDAQNKTAVWNSSYRLVQHMAESSTPLNDSTSNSNNANKRSAGEPAQTTNAKIGYAQAFDGGNDYVSIPNATSVSSFTDGKLSMSLWVYPRDNTSEYDRVFLKSSSNDGSPYLYYGMHKYANEQKYLFVVKGTSCSPSVTTTTLLPLNTWSQLTGTYDGYTARIYINGVLNASSATSPTNCGAVAENTMPVEIGRNYFNREYYNALVDEARIQNAALTAAEIAANYKNDSDQFATVGAREYLGGWQNAATVDGSTGTFTIGASYSYSENIKVKVADANGIVGYSNALLIVNAIGTCPAIMIDVDQTWKAGDVPGGVFDCRGLGTFTVKTGKTLSLKSYDSGDADWSNDFGATILADNFNVENGGTISADGLGYGLQRGPHPGWSSTYDGYGAAHGGYSTAGAVPYGNVFEPSEFGSGGGGAHLFCGDGGSGGGLIKLVASSGTLTNNGTITANAGTDSCKTGAGGSVWIDVNTIAGSGVIQANSTGAGQINSTQSGGGGRVALYYANNAGYNLNYSGLKATGGINGGPGTVYVEQKGVDSNHHGTLLVDNAGTNAGTAGLVEGSYEFKLVKLTRYGHLEVMGDNSVITVSSSSALQGDDTKPLLNVTGTFNYTEPTGYLKLDGLDLGVHGKITGVNDLEIGGTNAAGVTLYAHTWWYNKDTTHAFHSVLVKGNGTLFLSSYVDHVADYGVVLSVTDMTVEASGVVSATGRGYGAADGPAGGGSSTYDGYSGGHGGHGQSRVAYGSTFEPVTLGSGGGNSGPFCGGAAGGGAMKLLVSGTLTNNGTIESNGATWGCNNAAGGSIWIDTNAIAGSTGTIIAQGSTDGGHGGAGGRIALYYGTNTDYRANVNGIIAYGYSSSGPGTIYIEQKGVDTSRHGLLLIDNAGRNGGSAGLIEDNYNFKLIQVTRYGHMEVMGQNSTLTVADGTGMQGDDTRPRITVSGTFIYTSPNTLKLDGVDLGINGKMTGVNDVEIGGGKNGGLTLYGHTWWYNKTVTHTLGNVLVKTNGIFTAVGYDGTNNDDYGVVLNASSFTIEPKGLVTATGRGYSPGAGPGAGASSTYDAYGAAHGGHGDNNVAYGSVYEPLELGSGGGSATGCSGAWGGGALKLAISGTLTNDGTIESNGGSSSCSGGTGAGGSIWIDTNTIAGAGIMNANGSAGDGAGGRIAVYYATNTNYRLDVNGITTYSSASTGPGTIYLEHKGVDSAKNGTLLVDNNGRNVGSAGLVEESYSFKLVNLTRYGHLEVMGQNSVINISDGSGMQGDNTKPRMTVSGTFAYSGTNTLKLDGIDLGINGKITGVNDFEIGGVNNAGVTLYANTWWYNKTTTHTFGSMTVKSNGTLTLVGHDGAADDDYGVSLTLANLTVEQGTTGGKITAVGQGYGGAAGPGGGASSTYDGYAASHGGHGEVGRLAYDSPYEPVMLGSGGGNSGPFCGGGPGGGAIKLTISGTLTNNGSIDASAGQWGCNNGAGGSVWINTDTITGGGLIAANGGTTGSHGGAGGRIAIYYGTNNGYNLNTTGITAYGYGNSSGPGTIYLEQKGVDTVKGGLLLVDNAGRNAGFAGLPEDSYNFRLVNLKRYGHLEVMGEKSIITLIDGAGVQGDNTRPQMKVSGTFSYTGAGTLKLDGVDLGINGKASGLTDVEIGGSNAAGVTVYAKTWWYNKSVPLELRDLTVKGNGIITFVKGDDYGPTIKARSITIEPNGSLTAYSQGYGGAGGPGGGASSTYDSYGASHGGYYTPVMRVPYGDMYQPTTLGSGGGHSGPFCGGGAGGGAIKLVLTGTLTNNGTITSNAQNAISWVSCGNGAGGSIWVDTDTISGTGTMTANGNGRGAGGRIAVYYKNNNNALLDRTHVTAFGNSGGGPGTIYLEHVGVHRAHGGDLILNNNNVSGRAQDFDGKTYEFNDVYIGQNITVQVHGDTSALNTGVAPIAAHPVQVDSSVVGAWGFEDDTTNIVRDSSANGHNGSTTDNIISVEGKFGKAINVRGTAPGVQIAEGVPLSPEYTIDAWLKFPLPATGDGWRTIFQQSGTSYHHIIVHSNGQLGYYNYGWADSGYNINSLTGWHHLASVVTSSTTTFYIDGVKVGNTINGAIHNEIISSICNAGYSQQCGYIDEARIQDFAMTPQQVAAAAAATEAPVADSHTLGLWHFEDSLYQNHDSSASQSHDGATAGTAAEVVPGKFGSARNFSDGSTMVIDPITLSGNWTIDTWMKFPMPTTGAGWRSVVARDIGSYHPIMISSAGKLGMYAAGFYDTGVSLTSLTGWHHIAVVASGTTTTMYLDGVKAGNTFNVNPTYTIGNIGNYAPNPAYQAGSLDALRVSNKAFTATEVLDAASATTAPLPDDSTVALWQFDDTKNTSITDASNNHYNAQVFGTTLGAGKIGNARQFEGSYDYMQIPTVNYDFSGGFSIAFWAKPTSYGGYARFIDFGNGQQSDNIIISRYSTGDAMYVGFVDGGTTTTSISSASMLINNEWHHYAITVTPTHSIYFYRDGQLITTQTAPGIVLPKTVARTKNYIGKSNWANALYAGSIDELVLYNRVLSSDEVRANMFGLNLTEYQMKTQQLVGRGIVFDLTGNFTLASGAVINGDGAGFPSDFGSGHGAIGVGYSGGGGGANGGEGGEGQSDGTNTAAAGGRKYGDQLSPTTLGSGGGSSAVGAPGGIGGGAVAIIAHGVQNDQGQYINGDIKVDGTISVNGTVGKTGSPGGGGGAGGSILLHGNTCTINGTLSAVGGAGGNSDVDGGNGGGGHISVLYNVGPCVVTGPVSYGAGVPADLANFGASEGQIGTYPPEPNSVPWPSEYRQQFELKSTTSQIESGKTLALARSFTADVLGISENVIPVGGIINGTTVTLKADAYDAGARTLSPKRLKIQVELKKVNQSFDGQTGLYESTSVNFTGGTPVILTVTASNLDMGVSYKWRVRTVNIDNNLYSEWRDFGNNGANEPDFTITTVAALDLSIDKTTMNLPDSASLTVVARDSSGNVDTSYRGTVHFRSDSSSAQLPADYTFTGADSGQHTFADSVKFFEVGSYTITVEDTANPVLVDTVGITITAPLVPYLAFGASLTSIPMGGSTVLQWESGNVNNLSIDHSVGSVSSSGSVSVSPEQTTTYTLSGTSVNGDPMTASVTITVLAPNIPTLSLHAVLTEILQGSSTTLTWESSYVHDLHIDQSVGIVDPSGSASVSPNTTTTYTISGTTEAGDPIADSVTITVIPNNTPFLSIGATALTIRLGNSTNLAWQSAFVNELVISNGIGSVSASGGVKVSPVQTTTYTISGISIYGKTMTASVTIVVTTGPVVTPTDVVIVPTTSTTPHPTVTQPPVIISPPVIVNPNCPVIQTFKTSNNIIRANETFSVIWKVSNAQKVNIDAFPGNLPLQGSSSMQLKAPQDITIKAIKGTCQRTSVLHIEVVNAYPWEGAGGVLVGVAVAEAFQGNVWLALLGLIDRAKKKKPWGITYDAATKKLLPRVTLRLWNAQTGSLVDTVVSDANGIFKLAPKKGKYVIKATIPDYLFPSVMVNTETDTGYMNVYRGEVITVDSDDQIMMVSIPLDPEKKKSTRFTFKDFMTILHNAIDIISPIVLIAGFVYSLVVTIMYPLLLNALILIVYGIVFGIKLVGYMTQPRLFGVVTSVDGKVVSGLEIGLYDKEFNTLVARTFTNKKGAYNFVVKNQDYYIQVLDPRYKLLSRSMTKDGMLVPHSNARSAVRLITESFMVYSMKQ